MKTSFTTMKTKTFFLSLILLFAGWANMPNAQAQGYTDFWFVAPHLSEQIAADYPLDRPAFFALSNGTSLSANVQLVFYNGGTPITINQTIAPGELYRHVFPGNNNDIKQIENPRGSAGTVTTYGVHITSDIPITGYYMANNPASRDIFTLKGTPALGAEFYVPMQHDNYFPNQGASYANACDQIDIVATEDNTVVTVTPKASIRIGASGSSPAGTTLTYTLNKGQTLKIMEHAYDGPSLAGTHISATKPVAVTVAEDLVYGDTSGDQIVPVSSLGKRYVIAKGYMLTAEHERVYMIATAPNTNISINGSLVATLNNPGDAYVYVFPSTEVAVIADATSPVYCYQRTGLDEQGAALLPSMYSIGQNKMTFFQVDAVNEKAFLVFRTGTASGFTISYDGNTSPLNVGAPISIPLVAEWQCARFDLPTAANDKVVTIANPQSKFSLGYIAANSGTIGYPRMTFYGYMSQFGTYSLSDTTNKCPGASVTLDAGYAASYDWTLPDGSHLYTQTITATDTGVYSVDVNLDPIIYTTTTRVVERFIGATIVSSGGNDVGAGVYTYSVDIHGQSLFDISYVWKVDGVQVSTAAIYSATWTSTDEHLITVELTDDVLGCTKTLSHVHHKPPDNISEASCFVTPDPINFSIKSLASTTSNDLDVLTTPLIGDVDNDGEIEILHPSRISSDYSVVVGSITELRIYGVKVTAPATPNAPQLYPKYTIPLVGSEFSPPGTTVNPTYFSYNTFYTFAKVDPPHSVTGKQYAAIFLATVSGKLYKYEFNPTSNAYEETHSVMFNPSNRLYVSARPILSDLMSDGHVQVCILDKIYDAENLTLLATLRDAASNPVLPTNHTLSSYSFGFIGHGVFFNNTLDYSQPSLVVSIDDIEGDGKKEIIAGDCVYKVDIKNYSGESGNTYRLAVRANKQSDLTTNIETRTDIYDGCGVIIDIDLDGRKDVVVTSRGAMGGDKGYLYAYDPLTGQVKNTAVTSISTDVSLWRGGPSFPFIGDLDNDKYPEICFGAGSAKLYAFKYNPVTQRFVQFWNTTTNDDTGCIGLSLFDFEQDNQPEVVYRDDNHLYIWDGSKNPPVSVNPPVTGGLDSRSASEYPVIADVNGDGFADIIVTGGGDGFYGNLRIFTSAGAPWAPARSVWHMSPSQPLYINDDLTIPRYPLSPTTVFPGADGDFSTASDNVRPFNNYMQQATALNRNGNYIWLTPDAKFAETPVFNYYGDGDSLVISTELTNIGDAALNTPFYISAYKNTVVAANKMVTESSMISLNVNDKITTTVTIRNFSSYAPLTKIILRINDKGEAKYVQQECDYDNNVYEYDFADLPKAANDTVATLINTEITKDVKFNDAIPAGCPSPVLAIAVTPTKGVASLVGDQIKYTPNTDFFGVDSLVYRLTCTKGKTEAKVYIVVNKPIAGAYIGCPGTNVTAGFEHIDNVEYLWYTVETGGTTIDVARDTRPCEAPSEWWVEAQYKGKSVAPRFKITVAAYPVLTPGSIKDDDTICYNTVPQPFDNVASADGGNGTIQYQWQYSEDNGGQWDNITGETSEIYTPTTALTQTTWYRRKARNDCGTVHTDSVKITVYPQSLENYPDLRIRVCPDAGTSINLSKYIDTLAVETILWKSISPPLTITNGTISADNLNEYTSVYTLTYTVGNPCLSSGVVERKVYLERLKHGKMRPLRDAIVVCYKLAERLQLNQIFGVDAAGTWLFDPDVTPHITHWPNGAVIMNGKAIYGNNTGNVNVKVTYKPGNNSCLKDKEYSITIILTPDIVNN
jgi:hypothetical protein